jgi:membrane protein
VDIAALLRVIDRFQRGHAWAGLPVAVMKRFGDHSSGNLAAAIAFFGFFSLFPLLLAFTSLASIAVAGDPELQQRLVDSAVSQFPVVGEQISGSVGSIEGSGLALAVGIALAIWSGIGGIRAAQVAMDTVWDVPRRERSSFPIAIARAFLMLAVLGSFVLAGAVLGGSASGIAGGWLQVPVLVASGVLNFVVFMLAYRVLTVASVRWGDVVPGAMLGGITWTVLVAAGGWIVSDRVNSSSAVYGTFAVVIGLLAWIYLGAQVTLVGAELNAVLVRRLWPRSLVGGDVTSADQQALDRAARQEERTEDEIVDVRFRRSGSAHGGPRPTR